jgi:peptidoglycan-associated lipoprotein
VEKNRMIIRQTVQFSFAVALVSAALVGACVRPQTPVARPTPPPPPVSSEAERPPQPPDPVVEPMPVPPEPFAEEDLNARDLDALNRDSPLEPVFFAYDSQVLDDEARGTLDANATLLRRYPNWVITLEGHCDERGTAEYNLALGERRALAARAYLVQVGISGERLRTVSYGKEFPFDPGHDEAAWAKNRRAHFVITSK